MTTAQHPLQGPRRAGADVRPPTRCRARRGALRRRRLRHEVVHQARAARGGRAWFTGRPVKVAVDAEGAMLTTRADAAAVRVQTGFDTDGHIVGRDFDLTLDSGAYTDNSPLVLTKSANRCFGPYRLSHRPCAGPRRLHQHRPGLVVPRLRSAAGQARRRAEDRRGRRTARHRRGGKLRRRNLLRHGETVTPGKRPSGRRHPGRRRDRRRGTRRPRRAERVRTAPWSGPGRQRLRRRRFALSTAVVRLHSDGWRR